MIRKKKYFAAQVKQLPRAHKRLLMGLCGVVSIALIWQPNIDVSPSNSRSSTTIDIADINLTPLSAQDAEPMGDFVDTDAPEFSVEQDELDEMLAEADTQSKHKVVEGETLGQIFNQYGLPLLNMYQLLDVDGRLSTLGVGQTLEWVQDRESGRVLEFRVRRDRKNTDAYVWDTGGYDHVKEIAEGEFHQEITSGRVEGNFYTSASKAGLTPTQIQNLVKALQYRFDFGRQSRRGDQFAVSVEKEVIDGRSVGSGRVTGLLYRSGNNEVFAMLHDDGNFYDADGGSLNRALMRVPLEKRYRISSSFNPNRKHPITGRVQPHNGTDFATPTGTPVLASGHGVVVKSEYHYAAGNYVVIRHGREYMTRYLHLDKRLVNVGQTVSMGQRIGLSGNTGRSTGPHLHYELIRNNRAVDAMRVPLPQADPLQGGDRTLFVKRAKGLTQEMEAKLK